MRWRADPASVIHGWITANVVTLEKQSVHDLCTISIRTEDYPFGNDEKWCSLFGDADKGKLGHTLAQTIFYFCNLLA